MPVRVPTVQAAPAREVADSGRAEVADSGRAEVADSGHTKVADSGHADGMPLVIGTTSCLPLHLSPS